MSILTFPTLRAPSSSTFQLVTNTLGFQSPLNKTTQTLELPGARWVFALTYQNLTDSERRILKAFIAQLRGAAGRFYLWDHNQPYPSGIATGTPVVNGAGQTGSSLSVSGWTASKTGILKAGDYFQVGTELKMMVADANSNGSGIATLTFEPPLRAAPANGASIITTRPKCIMRLKDDEQDRFPVIPGHFSNVTLEGSEVF